MRTPALALAIGLIACGSDEPESLRELDITRMSTTVDFDAAMPDQPQLVASLAYRLDAEACPELDVAADLDGVALTASPGGTGKANGGCHLGFVLDADVGPAGSESTIRFHDASGEASFAVTSLLQSRVLMPSVPQGSVVHAGDGITFPWPVDSDSIEHIEGAFVAGAEETPLEPSFVDRELRVMVPSLAPGPWTLSVGVLAHGSVARCDADAECKATVLGEGVLSMTIE